MKKKQIIALALVLALLCSLPVLAAGEDADDAADVLNALGLFRGTGEGYELDRSPTRAEVLVMLIKLSNRLEPLGKGPLVAVGFAEVACGVFVVEHGEPLCEGAPTYLVMYLRRKL